MLDYLPRIENNFEPHIENDYNDFLYERNVPVMLSQDGPNVAIGDVNGDGMDDIFIGAAAGQVGQLYINNGNGYTKKEQAVFEEFKTLRRYCFSLF